MTISFGAAGTGAQGTTQAVPTLPAGVSAGDLLLIFSASGNPTDSLPSIAAGGWSLLSTQVGGTGAFGSGTGNRIAAAFWKIADGSESSTNITVTNGAGGTGATIRADSVRVSTTLAFGTPVAVSGADSTSNTSWSITGGSNPGGTAGDLVFEINALATTAALTMSSSTFTWTGTTGTLTSMGVGTAAGNGVRLMQFRRDVATGTASAAPVFTATLSGSAAGAGMFVLPREILTTGADVAASVSVTAAGVKGLSTGAPVSASVAVTAAGVKGSSTGADVAASVAVSATGSTKVTQGASVAASVAITAAGSLTTILSSGASVAASVAVTATGSTKVTKGASVAASVAITAAGGLVAPGPGGLPTILVEIDDTSGTFPYDISSFVDLSAGYSIQHGRSDQFEDIEASVLTMTLNNRNGDFVPGAVPFLPVVDQPIRVTHTVAGSPSKRFTGYVQRWPVQWSDSGMDRLSTVTITAVDRLPSWARKPLRTVVEEEHLRRMAPSGNDAYWPLSEPAGATTSTSIVPANISVLTVAGRGAAILFAAGTAPTYGPTAAALFSAGQYLTASDSVVGGIGGTVLSCFVNTSTIPPGSSTLMRLDGDGSSGNPRSSQRLYVTSTGQAGASMDDGLGTVVSITSLTTLVNDGITHHVALRTDGATLKLYVDGVQTNSIASTAATYAGTLYVGNDPDGNGYVGTLSHVATSSITAADILELSKSGLTGFAGERSDQRVARLLDRAGVPSGSMSLETGAQTMPVADTWEGTTIADALGEVVIAEHGLVFVAGDGTAVMQNRYHRASETTPDATLDAHDISGDVQVLYDMDQGVNYVTGTRTNGVPQLAQDPNSINGHGTYPVDLGSLLVTTDGQVLDACWWRVNSYSEPVVRLPGATVDLLTQPTTFQQAAMGLEISDRFAVTNMPYPDFADQTIEGWTETVQASLSGAEWSLQFNTTPWTVDQMWILGDTTYGVLDSTTRLGL